MKKKVIIVIDEIGKMESFSDDFNQIVRNLVFSKENENNNFYIIGTVAMKHGGLAEEVRNRAGFKSKVIKEENKNLLIWEVTYENRDHMVNNVIMELEKMLKY